MKSVVTWIVLANTREVRVLENRGPGKGLVPLAGKHWEAEDIHMPRDKPGIGHSIAGPVTSAVEHMDRKRHSSELFAHEIMRQLSKSLAAKEFDRLVLVSGPMMLGFLRKPMGDQIKTVLIDEIAKDLSTLPIGALETHLGEVMAI